MRRMLALAAARTGSAHATPTGSATVAKHADSPASEKAFAAAGQATRAAFTARGLL